MSNLDGVVIGDDFNGRGHSVKRAKANRVRERAQHNSPPDVPTKSTAAGLSFNLNLHELFFLFVVVRISK